MTEKIAPNHSFLIKSTFVQYLEQLQKVLNKVPDELFSVSLASDMFSLVVNAKIACNFVLRGFCPYIDKPVPKLERAGQSREDINQQLQDTLDYLSSADVSKASQERVLTDTAGFAEVSLPASEFMLRYIIPNVLFHVSMVYAIARQNGVVLSKADFDGLHEYPPGFSFL